MNKYCALTSILLAAFSFLGCSSDSSDATTSDATSTSAGTSTTGGSTDGGSTSTSTTGGGGENACSTSMIVASEANDYSFSSTLTFPPISVAPNTELTFDWSALTKDFLGHPLDPNADIDAVHLMLWKMAQQELETKLNADQLAQRDLAVIATIPAEGMKTSGSLFELTSVGMPLKEEEILPFVDPVGYPPEANTYTIMAATGNTLGEGTRMIQAFKLDPESTNTMVTMTDDSTHLKYTVDLTSLQMTPVPLGNPAITFDWSDMTTNGLGNEFVLTKVDRVVVARYAQTPTELQAKFIDLVRYDGSIVADELYSAQVAAGSKMDLSMLADESGAVWPGIDGTSTWMLALFCSSCQNPAPWYLTFLTACP